MPEAVKNCLHYYDTDKLQSSNPRNRRTIIFNVLNNRWLTDEVVSWLQKTFTQEEIKAVIEDSYASEWWIWNLKRWADFYKVCPKWKYKLERVLENDPEKDKILATMDDSLWPYSGNNIWEEIKQYRG